MVFGRAGLVHPAEHFEQAKLFDAGKDLRDTLADQFFFLYVFNIFSRQIEVHEHEIFAVVAGFVDRHAAADVLEQNFEFRLAFFEFFLWRVATIAWLRFFIAVGFHILPPLEISILKHTRPYILRFLIACSKL